jgi:hypothetical protein
MMPTYATRNSYKKPDSTLAANHATACAACEDGVKLTLDAYVGGGGLKILQECLGVNNILKISAS